MTIFQNQPPLLVQRCNGSYGTTAGVGYLEVNVICPCKSPGKWPLSELSISIGQNGSADFNLNLNQFNTAPKEARLRTTSRPHHQATPKQSYCKCTNINTNLWNKKSKRVALATKNYIISKPSSFYSQLEILFWNQIRTDRNWIRIQNTDNIPNMVKIPASMLVIMVNLLNSFLHNHSEPF